MYAYGVQVLQSCLTLCKPLDCHPPFFSVHTILQAGILQWVPCPPPGGLPDPEMEPASLRSSAFAGETFTARVIIYTQPNYDMLLMKCDLLSQMVKCKL